MAWRSSGKTNAELIKNLVGHKMITSERVNKAMLAVRATHLLPRNRSALCLATAHLHPTITPPSPAANQGNI